MPDLLVADPRCGVVWILSGKSGDVLLHITSTEPVDGFGHDACGIGDVDGDGCADFIIGSGIEAWDLRPGSNPVPEIAVVVSGKTGKTIFALHGEPGHRSFARFVHGVGDIDGDGKPDFAVSGAQADAKDADAIFATVFSGSDAHVLLSIPGRPPDLEYDGVLADKQFGIALPQVGMTGGGLAAPGDVDGDGRPDMATIEWFPDTNKLLPAGRFEVRVLSGKDARLLSSFELPRLEGSEEPRLCAAGDFDHDGVPDLIASIPGQFVRVISGKNAKTLVEILDHDAEAFGDAVRMLPDIDGDGVPDLTITASSDGVAEGSVRGYSGKSGALLWKTTGPDFGDLLVFHFGSTLDCIGDVNGDGITDLVVGVQHVMYHGPGRAFVLSGKTGRILWSVVRAEDSVRVVR